MCDHTPEQRGQTYAEMMGDGTIRKVRPGNARSDVSYKRAEIAVDLLKKEGFGFAKAEGGEVLIHTKTGSLIALRPSGPVWTPARPDEEGEIPYLKRKR